MEKGRYVCHVMKAIRKAVADANGISYEPAKCTYVGECLVLAKVDTFMNNKKCVKQCERVQQSTARSSN